MQLPTNDGALAGDLRDGLLARELRGLLKTMRLLRGLSAFKHVGGHSGMVALLAAIGEAPNGSHVKDLAAELVLDTSTVSRSVSAAAALGFVERAADPTDKRACVLRLTEAGRAALRATHDWYGDLFAGALGGWDPAELTALARSLNRLTGDLTNHLERQRTP